MSFVCSFLLTSEFNRARLTLCNSLFLLNRSTVGIIESCNHINLSNVFRFAKWRFSITDSGVMHSDLRRCLRMEGVCWMCSGVRIEWVCWCDCWQIFWMLWVCDCGLFCIIVSSIVIVSLLWRVWGGLCGFFLEMWLWAFCNLWLWACYGGFSGVCVAIVVVWLWAFLDLWLWAC